MVWVLDHVQSIQMNRGVLQNLVENLSKNKSVGDLIEPKTDSCHPKCNLLCCRVTFEFNCVN